MKRGDLLVHPGFALALALLAVNDHVLKALAPGLITGKLSDFAGVFVFSIVLFVAMGRRLPALALTAVGFAAIKLSGAVAALAAPLLGGVTLQDSSDLIALLALVPASWLMTRHVKTPTSRSFLRPLVTLIAGVAVLFTVTATSCAGDPGVAAFSVDGDRLFARIDDANTRTQSWALSTDGGRTWASANQPSATLDPAPACTEGVLCFRVISDGHVEVREKGSGWQTAFAFTEEQQRRLDQRATGCSEVDTFAAVTVVEVAEQDHVVVAMGDQGVLHRAPSGEWERRSVLGLEPVPLNGPSWMAKLPLATLVLMLVSPLFLWLGRRRGSNRRTVPFAFSFVGGIALLFLSGLLRFLTVDYVVVGVLVVVLCVLVLTGSIVIATTAKSPEIPPPPPPPPPPPIPRQ